MVCSILLICLCVVQNMNTTTAKGKGAPQNANDATLIIEPLTTAYPRELVVYTPKTILMHPAYNDG